MEAILLEICAALRENETLGDERLARIIRRHNRALNDDERRDNRQHFSKKRLLPYYLRIKETDPERWAGWGIDQALELRLLRVLQVKPRRTASGVATITVITKPWKCSGTCRYCPSDLRMPKSYLGDEPACQRAERNCFDPYLQVMSRLRALTHMGHATDKVELIILGGTWSDYPVGYQIWFVEELFRALNEGLDAEHGVRSRRRFYRDRGISNRADELAERVKARQREVDSGLLTYNQAIQQLYDDDEGWKSVAREQVSDFDALFRQHAINESAPNRVVGLVVETRPDAITPANLKLLRRLGCTRVQVGIQSLSPAVLSLNNRDLNIARIQESFELLRAFGFKIHAHFMVNLYGSTPEADKADYRRLVTSAAYLPDEVKLYPCSLVGGTRLYEQYVDGSWRPYEEHELLDILVADLLDTPVFMRISRMVRDISARDILVGNRKANLRQLVEARVEASGQDVLEIRYREISTDETDVGELALETHPYETTISDEYFLQWVTPEGRIAGFLRLSLPKADYVRRQQSILPIKPCEAMIREVHVYGKVARLHRTGEGAQHLGLGRRLIEAACDIARARGYVAVNVISSVGTREYYRSIGFSDNALYQQKSLVSECHFE
jgi:elongator complex protein 3